MKRLLSLFLSAVLLLTTCCVAATAAVQAVTLSYSLDKPAGIDNAAHVKFGDFFTEGQTNAMSHVAAAGPYVFLKDLGLGDFTVPFTVSEDGDYQFGITLLVLSTGKERATRVQIDNGPVYDVRYTNTEEQNGQKQYVTGITQTLTAGDHTFTLSLPADFNDDTVKTLYFFDFFYILDAEISIPVIPPIDLGTLISQIGEVTLEKEPLILKARAAYESLSDEEKALVTKLDILENAEATLADLKAAKAMDDKLAKIMEELPSMNLQAVENAIMEARAAYEALTDSQKEHVTLLDACEKAVQERIRVLNQQAADAVKELIEKIPTPVTFESEKAIVTARSAFEALTDAQKALVSNYADLEKAEKDFWELPVSIMGDVNQDRTVNANDALMVLKAAVNKITLTTVETRRADLNQDGTINAVDALAILKIAVGKEA